MQIGNKNGNRFVGKEMKYDLRIKKREEKHTQQNIKCIN